MCNIIVFINMLSIIVFIQMIFTINMVHYYNIFDIKYYALVNITILSFILGPYFLSYCQVLYQVGYDMTYLSPI